MSDKVIWLEGMVLSPHHLQQSDQQHEVDHIARWQWQAPSFYGVASLDIDPDALGSGFFRVREASGVFPDGTAFHFPKQDAQLDQRPFEEAFPAGKDSLAVYLALPALTPGNANLEGEPGRPARYLSQVREVQDINTGGTLRPITFGRLNLRLLFEGESPAGFQTLKIAELKRDGQGRPALDDSFIPPCVRLTGSANLNAMLKKMLDGCMQKSQYLMSQRAQKATGVAQFSAETLTNWLLLNAVNSALPELAHALQQGQAHPESVYRQLLRFAGSLMAFGQENRLGDLPRYQHGDLRASFKPLLNLIDLLLSATVPTGYRMFNLARMSPVQYAANLRDADFHQLGQFFLGVSAQASEVEVITAVQRKAKLAAAARIETLVSHALPGVSLVPETAPPQGIPAKAGFKYFRLHQNGDLWEQIVQSRTLALHMPPDLPQLRLELVAISN
jgi:type VI secretion system protein ImpJ